MLRINNLSLPLTYSQSTLVRAVSEKAKCGISNVKLVKKSIDARDKGDVHYVVSVEFSAENEDAVLARDKHHVFQKAPAAAPVIVPRSHLNSRPVVVGCGPAGLFAGLTLASAGANPIVIERGKPVEQRTLDVQQMMENGKLNPNSNVQFGEGGAGTFSDGKLTTGIKSPYQRTVLETFVKHGAPEEILWEQKPHIGTDLLRNVIISMRKEIISQGGTVLFGTRLTELIIHSGKIAGIIVEDVSDGEKQEILTDNLLLALGHSSRDTLPILLRQGVTMTQKPFAMGVRIEHLQSMINFSQYGNFAKGYGLPAAPYKLAVHTPDERGVYTFCMCPGGQVIPSASEEGHLVTNGMSCYARDMENANAALLVGIKTTDFPGDSPLAGMELQRRIEHAAYIAGGGNYKAPVQLVGDFLQGRASKNIGSVVPSYKPGYTLTDLRECLPDFIADNLKFGIRQMDRQLKGFGAADAVLTGVESRTSSPVRMNREKNYQSAAIAGLYPVGEGAGYAGGIVSAAVDGISAAMAVLNR